MDFVEFPKIARLSRPVIVTEKIDGTNASIHIEPWDDQEVSEEAICVTIDDVSYALRAGSRTRWITPKDDNYGFAAWVYEHAEELVKGLGPGHHFGEWWGKGIQRGYGLQERRFSLFNTSRWREGCFTNTPRPHTAWPAPSCCSVVPVLDVLATPHSLGTIYWWPPQPPKENTNGIVLAMQMLKEYGSRAAHGFMNPEGIVVYHTAANTFFKKTFEKDDGGKGR